MIIELPTFGENTAQLSVSECTSSGENSNKKRLSICLNPKELKPIPISYQHPKLVANNNDNNDLIFIWRKIHVIYDQMRNIYWDLNEENASLKM